jgi:hypothetical protein
MCIICDGMSHEESNQRTMLAIERYGWSIVGVEAGPRIGWAYTIGLLEGFDQPELVVVGVEWPASADLLNRLGERAAAGASLHPGMIGPPPDHAGFGAVAPEHWKARSTFAGWQSYYEWRGGPPADPVAVQVFVPGEPASRLVRLDDPDADLSRIVPFGRPPS